jgi:NAD(P)H-dependent flavin oxidoreductase YrpB (nitropropane dioxygenase family)
MAEVADEPEACREHVEGFAWNKPDDLSTVPAELINAEVMGMNAVLDGDEENALMAAGECAQRIDDMPTAEELVQRIVNGASEILETLPKRFLR